VTTLLTRRRPPSEPGEPTRNALPVECPVAQLCDTHCVAGWSFRHNRVPGTSRCGAPYACPGAVTVTVTVTEADTDTDTDAVSDAGTDAVSDAVSDTEADADTVRASPQSRPSGPPLASQRRTSSVVIRGGRKVCDHAARASGGLLLNRDSRSAAPFPWSAR